MIQSDCGLVLRPICVISSATSAGLLSEHAPLQQRQKINTHTCKILKKKKKRENTLKKNKEKHEIPAEDFLLLWNQSPDNEEVLRPHERKS